LNAELGPLLGGLGLLLLGMGLLTDGLRMAAGQALHRLLALWTRTRLRGLATGALLTAIVQSSSAVTVATIGFANAGLLTLERSAWVVFGSNVGTTMTSWLVALIGLQVQISALALPMLGLGALMRLLRPGTRVAALGEAVAGFGLLFLGLSFLKDSLVEVGHSIDLSLLEGPELWRRLLAVLAGALITTLVQSSSAALAIILTTVSQGVLSLQLGAAMVVGANVGTTSTALLASIGAAPNARRVAALHVAFNLLTAVAAFLLLDLILAGVVRLAGAMGFDRQPAVELAVFHTATKLLGVLLMVPLSDRLVRMLGRRFVSQEEDLARPRHLDRNVLEVPQVAIEALRLESLRATGIAAGLARDALRGEDRQSSPRRNALRRLLVAIGEQARALGRVSLPDKVARELPQLLRAQARLLALSSLADEMRETRAQIAALGEDRPPELDAAFLASAIEALTHAGADGEVDTARCGAARDRLEAAREVERRRILDAALRGELPIEAAGLLLQLYQLVRRAVAQAWKALISIDSHPAGEARPQDPAGEESEIALAAAVGADSEVSPGAPS
jgi:phosphate:Na+ symporter